MNIIQCDEYPEALDLYRQELVEEAVDDYEKEYWETVEWECSGYCLDCGQCKCQHEEECKQFEDWHSYEREVEFWRRFMANPGQKFTSKPPAPFVVTRLF